MLKLNIPFNYPALDRNRRFTCTVRTNKHQTRSYNFNPPIIYDAIP